jgi:hypothetical protein
MPETAIGHMSEYFLRALFSFEKWVSLEEFLINKRIMSYI